MALILYRFELYPHDSKYDGLDELLKALNRHSGLAILVKENILKKEHIDGSTSQLPSYHFYCPTTEFHEHVVFLSSRCVEIHKVDPGIADYMFSAILYLFAKQTIERGGGAVISLYNPRYQVLVSEKDILPAVFLGDQALHDRARSPFL